MTRAYTRFGLDPRFDEVQTHGAGECLRFSIRPLAPIPTVCRTAGVCVEKSLRFFKVRIFSHFLWTSRSQCFFTACCAAQTEAPRQIGYLPKCIAKAVNSKSDNQGSERAGGQFCVTTVTINASHSVARWSHMFRSWLPKDRLAVLIESSDQTPSEVVHRVVGTKGDNSTAKTRSRSPREGLWLGGAVLWRKFQSNEDNQGKDRRERPKYL